MAARQFAKEKIIPAAADLDKTMKFPHELFNQVQVFVVVTVHRNFRDDSLSQAWEQGFVNAHIPEAYGGLGLHTIEAICVLFFWSTSHCAKAF
jgi:acyl-CoA dehydrogenase